MNARSYFALRSCAKRLTGAIAFVFAYLRLKYAVIAFNGPITIIGFIIGKYSRDTFTPGLQLPIDPRPPLDLGHRLQALGCSPLGGEDAKKVNHR